MCHHIYTGTIYTGKKPATKRKELLMQAQSKSKSTYGLVIALLSLLIFSACTTGPGTDAAPDASTAPPAEESETAAGAESESATSAEAGDSAAQGNNAEQENAGQEDSDNALAGVQTFVIDPEQSEAAYIVEEELFADALTKYGLDPGFNEVRGTTQAIEGQFVLNFDDLSSALGENRFSVDMTTLTTDQRLRDNWIRTDGPSFNDYPVAEFIGTEIQNAPESYTPGEEVSFDLVGELTVREITRPITFVVTASLEGNTITGTATAEALLSDFGIEEISFANTLTVADPLTIEINFVAQAGE